MALSQYNFKIDETFKNELEKELHQSTVENKTDFLSLLLKSYQKQKSEEVSIDLSHFDMIDVETKNSIQNSFTHILNILEASLSSVKQEKIYIENERTTFDNSTKIHKQEITDIKSLFNEKLLLINNEHKQEIKELNIIVTEKDKDIISTNDLCKLKEKQIDQLNSEILNLQVIAKNTQNIILENKELRNEIKQNSLEAANKLKDIDSKNRNMASVHDKEVLLLTEKITLLEREIWKSNESYVKVQDEYKSCSNEIASLKKLLSHKDDELKEISAKFNISLGEIKVLKSTKKE